HTFTAISLANGTFLFSYLPPGNYTLTVEKEGYQRYMDAVTVRPNATTTLSIPLLRYPEPVIYGGGVKKEGRKYTFEVTYRDTQGREPQKIVVVVDGEEYTLTRSSGNISEGATYTTEIELKEGKHTYYFKVIGPDGEPVKATDSTPTSEDNPSSFEVKEPKKSSYLLPILGIIALIIVLAVVLFMLKKPEAVVEE
ncbi:MAG: carboxypeptidase regulatory-like domain-containing protein, partial [Thermoplasmata archaeon]|nr:carboxypeptidase regulatory-like domain-containing protein [Thermoplasmata archaeon]